MQIKQENDGHTVIDQLTGEEVLTCAIRGIFLGNLF